MPHTPPRIAFFTVFLLSCSAGEEGAPSLTWDCDEPGIWYQDLDEDGFGDPDVFVSACEAPKGFVADATDCDDRDAAVNPAAQELCDGRDNNCDGLVDEDAADGTTWYGDADGDGYGDDAVRLVSCSAPTGFVEIGGDCDDTRADVYPGAQEYCDGQDNDCNGLADDGAKDALTWYADGDGDGFGDPELTLLSCQAPMGYVDNGDDCDDTRADVYPGAPEYCNGLDNDCNGVADDDAEDAPLWYLDYDQDGFGVPHMVKRACEDPPYYVDNADDCDDLDPNTWPGAPEYCNGKDNDCNGLVDDNALDTRTWYADVDGDGYGNPAVTAQACAAPNGFVEAAGDCDDSDPSVHPGADERCDGVDNNCDGLVDGSDAVDMSTWYQDLDGDGYGNAAAVAYGCAAPLGYVATAGDCDDTDAAINPGALEYCDGVDNNCDGVVDESTALDTLTWYRDADGDGHGDPATTVTACSRPSGYVATGLDCDDGDLAVHPDAQEICNDGIDNNCSGVFGPCTMGPDQVSAVLMGSRSYDFAGQSVVYAGDVNGDGWDDLLVGAEYADPDYTDGDNGAAYLFYGPLSEGSLSMDQADVIFVGEDSGDQAASALAAGQDLNGDGYADFLISGKRNSAGVGTATGAAYLFYGPVEPGVVSLGDADAKIHGEMIWDFAGIFLDMVGDLDGDGIGDLAVAANSNDRSGPNSGTVYLLYGPVTGDVSLADADVMLGGEADYDYAGMPAGAGDVDGDGMDDLLVGVSLNDEGGTEAGKAYLIYGAHLEDMSLADADVHFVGASAGERLGVTVKGVGDVDHDGYDDIAISAPRSGLGASEGGAVFLYHSVDHGVDGLTSNDADVTFVCDEPNARFGTAIAQRDINGDGELDFLISANESDSTTGAAWLFLGPVSGTVYTSQADMVFRGGAEGDRVGDSVAFGGNVAGTEDGDAIVLGAGRADLGGVDAGAVYLVFGVHQ